MHRQGFNSEGEVLSSAYVEKDADYCFDLDCSDLPSLTRQEFAADADINTIMAQYEKTGVISHTNNSPPTYLDLSDVPDLQQAIHIQRIAEEAFMSLPAKTRAEFENDPIKFIQYAENPENLERMREWGLAPPIPDPEPPQKVEIINPQSEPTK